MQKRGGGGLSVSPAASWGTRLVEPPRRSGSIRAVVTPLVLAALAGLFGPAGIAMAGPEGPIASTSHHSTLSPTVSDSLKLRLKLPEKVKAGVAVPMTLRAENLRQEPLDLYLTGRPIAFDIIVLDEEGRVAWRRLEGEIISMVLRMETLAPGDILQFTHTWDQRSDAGDPVPPGTYTVRGELPAEGGPLVTKARTLRITP